MKNNYDKMNGIDNYKFYEIINNTQNYRTSNLKHGLNKKNRTFSKTINSCKWTIFPS